VALGGGGRAGAVEHVDPGAGLVARVRPGRLVEHDELATPAHAFLAPASRGFEELATDGERIALRAEHELVLLRIDGSLLGRITLPPATAAPRGLAFAQDELWVLERGRARLLALRLAGR
jgi:hypothetical protein